MLGGQEPGEAHGQEGILFTSESVTGRCADLLTTRGVQQLDDSKVVLQLLADERLLAEFAVRLKEFIRACNGYRDPAMPISA